MSQCAIIILSDSTRSYSSFSKVSSSANPAPEHAKRAGGWVTVKDHACDNDQTMSGYSSATYNDKPSWADIDSELAAS